MQPIKVLDALFHSEHQQRKQLENKAAPAAMPKLREVASVNAEKQSVPSQVSKRAAGAPNSQNKQAELALAQATKTGKETETTQAQRAPDSTPQRGGFKLDVEEGKRVLKVFDSKDILIYQLPPKGALRLIASQDSEQPPNLLAVA